MLEQHGGEKWTRKRQRVKEIMLQQNPACNHILPWIKERIKHLVMRQDPCKKLQAHRVMKVEKESERGKQENKHTLIDVIGENESATTNNRCPA